MGTLCVFQAKGMEEFKEFLCNTAGRMLLNFWLDCESYKDFMEEVDEDEIRLRGNALFR